MDSRNAEVICTQEVATIAIDSTPFEAAERMAETGVGSLVVLGGDGAPTGIVTDRDLTLRVVGHGGDPAELLIGDVMTSPVVSVGAKDSVDTVFNVMRRSGVRRVVVLDGPRLVGIVAMDDLVQSLAREMDDLGKETQAQLSRGKFERIHREIDRRLGDVSRRLQVTNWITRDTLLHEIRDLRARVREAAKS